MTTDSGKVRNMKVMELEGCEPRNWKYVIAQYRRGDEGDGDFMVG